MAAQIEGLREALAAFDHAPRNMMKVVKTAMRAGANATGKQLKAGVPSRWSDLTKTKVKTDYRGDTYARIGLRSKDRRQDQEQKGKVPDWFKAYYANYGTLENRDPSHRFANPVRRNTSAVARRRRNNRGQKPQRFFERAITGWETTFERAFSASIQKQKDKILKP